jgi:hypothetical protein
MEKPDTFCHLPFAISHQAVLFERPARIRQHRRKDTPPLLLNLTVWAIYYHST